MKPSIVSMNPIVTGRYLSFQNRHNGLEIVETDGPPLLSILVRYRTPVRSRIELSQLIEDQPPRRQTVFTISGGRDQAMVGGATDAVGHPFGQLVLVRWRPAAVVLEPFVRVSDGLFGRELHLAMMPGPHAALGKSTDARLDALLAQLVGPGRDTGAADVDERGGVLQCLVDAHVLRGPDGLYGALDRLWIRRSRDHFG